MKNILIVDDSKTVCAALNKIISEKLQFNVIIANNKKECEEKLLKYKQTITVAIVSLALIDAPNGEVIDSISKYKIPSIVLTGTVMKENFLKDKFIIDYVIKEGRFSYEYIVSLIKRVIANYQIEVLVVDDSKVIALQIVNLLKRYQLKCYYAADGNEALTILESKKNIKLIFTDFNMPNLNGLELTKKIRKVYSKDVLGIIAMTSDTSHNVVAQFLKHGANDFLYKNFSEEEFFARLNSNLEMLELFQTTRDKINKDYMTGMFNRRYFFDEGNKLYLDAVKNNDNVCVAMIDIDKFKNINDTYGHDIGDIAICEVAKIVNRYFIDDAIIARFGGEEFCVIQSKIDEEEFIGILEKIREEFETNVIKTQKGDIQYTVSIGYTIEVEDCLDDMVNLSDEGLYIAKNNGRNQVRCIQ